MLFDIHYTVLNGLEIVVQRKKVSVASEQII